MGRLLPVAMCLVGFMVFPLRASEPNEVKLLTIGASFWSAGGGGFKVLKEFLAFKGRKVLTDSSAGLPGYFRALKLINNGDLESLKPSQKSESYKKLCEKSVDSCLSAVKAQEWDFVCIMAHSSSPFGEDAIPTFDAFFDALKKNASPKTKFVATMTWVKDPKKQTHEPIQKYYREIAEKHGMLLAPSGDAFELVKKERPEIPIFRSDLEAFQTKNPGKTDRHPSVYGQYLNSCVVFAVITGESPVGLPAKLADIKDDFSDKEGVGLGTPMDIPPAVAKSLQEAAWRVVKK